MSIPEQRYPEGEEPPPPPYKPQVSTHLETSEPPPSNISPPPYPRPTPGTTSFSLIEPEPPPYQPSADIPRQRNEEGEVFSAWPYFSTIVYID